MTIKHDMRLALISELSLLAMPISFTIYSSWLITVTCHFCWSGSLSSVLRYCYHYHYYYSYDCHYGYWYIYLINIKQSEYIVRILLLLIMLSHNDYPLLNVYRSMENHHFLRENSLFLWPCSIIVLSGLDRVDDPPGSHPYDSYDDIAVLQHSTKSIRISPV